MKVHRRRLVMRSFEPFAPVRIKSTGTTHYGTITFDFNGNPHMRAYCGYSKQYNRYGMEFNGDFIVTCKNCLKAHNEEINLTEVRRLNDKNVG